MLLDKIKPNILPLNYTKVQGKSLKSKGNKSQNLELCFSTVSSACILPYSSVCNCILIDCNPFSLLVLVNKRLKW